MRGCSRCGGEVEWSFRFCPWCASPLRSKLVEFFRAHSAIEEDQGKALRVSRYLNEERHVRFSVWNEEGEAEAAISLDEDEAGRLASFLAGDASLAQHRLGLSSRFYTLLRRA